MTVPGPMDQTERRFTVTLWVRGCNVQMEDVLAVQLALRELVQRELFHHSLDHRDLRAIEAFKHQDEHDAPEVTDYDIREDSA